MWLPKPIRARGWGWCSSWWVGPCRVLGCCQVGDPFTWPPLLCRYYFKKVSHEFDCGVVFEEVREDEATLPIFEEKIIGKVEKID